MKDFETCRKILAERLCEHLEGKSILAFSKDVGICARRLNSWIREDAVPSMEYLIILAQKLNCSIDYLVGLEN
jgi:transcriptional regulator with XRE-family HTH domain